MRIVLFDQFEFHDPGSEERLAVAVAVPSGLSGLPDLEKFYAATCQTSHFIKAGSFDRFPKKVAGQIFGLRTDYLERAGLHSFLGNESCRVITVIKGPGSI